MLIKVTPPKPPMRYSKHARMIEDRQRGYGKGDRLRGKRLPDDQMPPMRLTCSKCGERTPRLMTTQRGRDLCPRCDNKLKDTGANLLVKMGRTPEWDR